MLYLLDTRLIMLKEGRFHDDLKHFISFVKDTPTSISISISIKIESSSGPEIWDKSRMASLASYKQCHRNVHDNN